MKLIDLHKEWMESGEMWVDTIPNGLCDIINVTTEKRYKSDFYLIKPNSTELEELKSSGFDCAYWASELPENASIKDLSRVYSPLRQTIVLLICAMNNEL